MRDGIRTSPVEHLSDVALVNFRSPGTSQNRLVVFLFFFSGEFESQIWGCIFLSVPHVRLVYRQINRKPPLWGGSPILRPTHGLFVWAAEGNRLLDPPPALMREKFVPGDFEGKHKRRARRRLGVWTPSMPEWLLIGSFSESQQSQRNVYVFVQWSKRPT